MMKDNTKAYHRKTVEFSMGRALAILGGLRGGEQQRRRVS